MNKAIIVATLILGFVLSSAPSYAQLNINSVVSKTKSAAAKDKQRNNAREAAFKSAKSKQQGRFNSITSEKKRQESLSVSLENQFASNETNLNLLRTELGKELGELQELFGFIQTTASEAQETYKTSLVSAQFPTRVEDIRKIAAKMSSADELISIDEIEEIWYQLQNEMTQQGKIVKFNAPVSFVAGEEKDEAGQVYKVYEKQDRTVTRVGVFNAVLGNDIATYKNELGLVMLEREMVGDFVGKSNDLQNSSDGLTSFYLDPSKGVLVSAFSRKPTLIEKMKEGKIVGYIIILLGLIALVVAIFKIIVLSGVSSSIKKQVKDLSRPSLNNPLGRLVKAYQDNSASDPESMELKLSESILRETPKLNSMLMFIKIVAVVAPLLGLLGTVTGMIQTFQSITLYGAGDPQMMAGGISQALVTTVLGLVVAIPCVFLHWFTSNKAKHIEEILEESATGLVAEQMTKT